MDQNLYYTINRSEFLDRLLIDEVSKANETRIKREEFITKNKMFFR